MRGLIRGFDRLVRWANGVFEFCDGHEGAGDGHADVDADDDDDGGCLLRLQWARAPHDLHLSDGTRVSAGDPVLKLHLWNERVPPIGLGGPDLAWAASVGRRLIRSFREAARWLAGEPGLADVRAIGGATVLIAPGGESGSLRLIRRLGFDVFPYGGPLGRFGEFWENLYTWGLMWAFNKATLRYKSLLRLRRSEVWMSVDTFLKVWG